MKAVTVSPPNHARANENDSNDSIDRVFPGPHSNLHRCFPGFTSLSSPVPSRASPPPPRDGSGAWAAAHGSCGGSSPSRFCPALVRSSHADTHPRWLAWSRGSRSLLANDCGAATVTCM